MLKRIKKYLKKLLPPPRWLFLREMKDLRKSVTSLMAGYGEQVAGYEAAVQEKYLSIDRQIMELKCEQERQITELKNEQERLITELKNAHECQITELKNEQERLYTCLDEMSQKLLEKASSIEVSAASASRHASEAVWGEIFTNTMRGSTWLTDDTISPGRWALGYPGLYALYRILNELRPQRILEFGLGQSTRLIGQYVMANEGTEHIVVENNAEWIAFFQNRFELSERTQILPLELEMRPYKDAEAVRGFKGIQEALQGKQFDLIFIDAPLGGDMKQYARIDVLSLLPDCLMSSFVIMLDDGERVGEQHTVSEIEHVFWRNHISYAKGRYSGDKDTLVIVSKDLRFICSM